jgi:hypothetical protein
MRQIMTPFEMIVLCLLIIVIVVVVIPQIIAVIIVAFVMIIPCFFAIVTVIFGLLVGLVAFIAYGISLAIEFFRKIFRRRDKNDES